LVAALLLEIAALAAPGTAAAQELPDRTRIWAGGGLAAGASKNVEFGFGALAQLVVQKRPHYASIRTLILGDIAGFPDSGGGDVIAEGGLTYGRALTGPFGHASMSAGLSLISFDACPDGQSEACYSIGMPLVAETALSARVIGIGLQVFANINPKATYGGLAVFFQLGWLP